MFRGKKFRDYCMNERYGRKEQSIVRLVCRNVSNKRWRMKLRAQMWEE